MWNCRVQGLENRIEFWKKVYTQYGEDDVIIHDRVHVNLIYDVAAQRRTGLKVSGRPAGTRRNPRQISQRPENLSPAAKQIRDAIMANGATGDGRRHWRICATTSIRRLGIKERFRDGVIRSGRYVEAFQEIFESEGLPPGSGTVAAGRIVV